MGGVPTSAPRGRRIRGLDAEQRRAQRRDQLLAAAFELFAQEGYANTSIEQICQTAYVGNKAFYELFESKEDCYLALMKETARRIEGLLLEELAQTPRDEAGSETIRRVLTVLAHALVDDARVVVVTFRECIGISPRIEAERRENREWGADFLEKLWRSKAPAGGDVDYRAIAVGTVGGVFEMVVDFVEDADPPRSVDDLARSLTSFVVAVENGIHLRDSID